jgi:hypothetical protein
MQLSWLSLMRSTSVVAGTSPIAQDTKDRGKWPFQLGRTGSLVSQSKDSMVGPPGEVASTGYHRWRQFNGTCGVDRRSTGNLTDIVPWPIQERPG